jgi:hypothetical protein
MQLVLSIQSSNGAIATVPVGETGLRIEAEPGSIYKLLSIDGTPVRGENVTVTRTGRDLSINGLLSTEPVVILDFFLACRFDTNCRFELSTLGANRDEHITPQTETLPRQDDGSFLMWSSNGDHIAASPAPAPEATPIQSESSVNGIFLAIATLGVLGLAASASGSGDSGVVANDPAPAPSPPPAPSDPAPAPTVQIDAVINDEENGQAIDNGDATNDVTPVIRGQLSEELDDSQAVQVVRDGQVIDEASVQGAQFEFVDYLEEDGEYTYQTVLTDADGNPINTSDEFVLILDTEAPEAPAIGRVEGNNIISEDEAEDGIEVSGSSESGATVSVSWGDLLLTTESDEDGDWSVVFDDAPFDEGLSTMTAVSTDQAGNTSSEQVRAVYLSSENADSVASVFGSQFMDVTGTL